VIRNRTRSEHLDRGGTDLGHERQEERGIVIKDRELCRLICNAWRCQDRLVAYRQRPMCGGDPLLASDAADLLDDHVFVVGIEFDAPVPIPP
jgi:hypothetical protein